MFESTTAMFGDSAETGPRARSGLTIIGAGREGIVHAVSLIALGFRVLAVDFDEDLIDALNRAELPFRDPDLAEQLRDALATAQLRFTTDFDEAASFGRVHFICLPLGDLNEQTRAGAVDRAASELAGRLTVRSLVVGQLAAPLGTAVHLAGLLSASARPGVEIELAWNPDAADSGSTVADVTHPDRLLFGVESAWAEQQLREVFSPILAEGTLLIVADVATTELMHAAATALTSTRISYLDDAGELCTVTRAEIDGMASVFPFGNWLSSRLSSDSGAPVVGRNSPVSNLPLPDVLPSPVPTRDSSVHRTSWRRRDRILESIREVAGGSLQGVRISAVGAPSASAGSASPTLDLSRALIAEGAVVTVFAAHLAEAVRRRHPQLICADSLAGAVLGADVLVLVTEWQEFELADPDDLGELVRARCIVDAQGVLDEVGFSSRGWQYRAPARMQRSRTIEAPGGRRDDWLLPA